MKKSEIYQKINNRLKKILITLFGYRAQFFRRKKELKKATYGEANPNIKNDDILIDRIIASYQRAHKKSLGNSMWQMFFDQRHKSIHEAFQEGKKKEASYFLKNPAESDLFYGIDNLCYSILPSIKKSTYNHAKLCFDGLIRFGESIGAFYLDNSEHYHLPVREWEADQVVDSLENFLKMQLNFPNPYPKELGLQTKRGIISYRTPQALYQAYLIKQLVKDIENPKILEIGAGLGRTAYYAAQFGIKDYTIIDIPMTAACSSYFLGKSLTEDQIVFLGEPYKNFENKIKILTPDELNENQKYDLVINVDSFTEMDVTTAKSYLKIIEKIAPCFLSINNEVNPFTIRNLAINSPYLQRYQRYPYWLRAGLVEEHFYFNSKKEK